MKKAFSFAIILVAAAIAVAVVSCKKDTQNATSNPKNQSAQAFDPSHITDMNAYLKDFKKKMQTSAERKDGESLSIEEAAWHLSSVANYDFANAGKPFDNLRFDTLYSYVPVTDGNIFLSDLAETYENISTDIDKFYHSLMLDDSHFHFIGTDISENGTVIVSLMTTFMRSSKDLNDTLWFYNDLWDLHIECDSFTYGYSTLPASTTGRDVFELFLNWKISHPLQTTSYYYTVTETQTFYYRNEIDPFGSPNYVDSRLFASNTYIPLDILPLFYYLCDSALEIGSSNCPSGLSIVFWKVIYEREDPIPQYHEHLDKEHYRIMIAYGERHDLGSEPGGNND